MNILDKEVYNKIARKDLTFWCRYIWADVYILEEKEYIFWNDYSKHEIEYWEYMSIDAEYDIIYPIDTITEDWWTFLYEIIGHKVLLSDVLDFLNEKRKSDQTKTMTVLKKWNFSKPTYEEQSSDCKNYIRSIV